MILVAFVLCLSLELLWADEIIPRSRLDPDLSDLAILRPEDELKRCPIDCVTVDDGQERLECSKETKLAVTYNFSCLLNARGEFTVGKKETISHIEAASMSDLTFEAMHRHLLTPGSRIHMNIRLSLVELRSQTFANLVAPLTELRIYNVFKMHPDALVDLTQLRYLEFESSKVPKPLFDDSILAENPKGIKSDTIAQLPAFLRLRPMDETVPIGFNLRVFCHRCPVTPENGQLLVVVFRNERPDASASAHVDKQSISLVYPKTCPERFSGIGCPYDVNGSQTLALVNNNGSRRETELLVNGTSLNHGWRAPPNLSEVYNDWTLTDNLESLKRGQLGRLNAAIIVLSVWCALITLVVLVLVLVFCRPRRSRAARPPSPKLDLYSGEFGLKNTNDCVQQFCNNLQRMSRAPDDDCKSVTTSSGFYTPSNSSKRRSLETFSTNAFAQPSHFQVCTPRPAVKAPSVRRHSQRQNGFLNGDELPPRYLKRAPRRDSSLQNLRRLNGGQNSLSHGFMTDSFENVLPLLHRAPPPFDVGQFEAGGRPPPVPAHGSSCQNSRQGSSTRLNLIESFW